MSLASDIEKISQQERELQFKSFSEADAWALGTQMRSAALAQNLPLVIDIRIAGRHLFFTALPGTTSDNEAWASRKINAVMRFHKSTYRLGREWALSGREMTPVMGMNPMEIVFAGGSFPIHLSGTGVVGTITVSGVPQRQDHGFVVEQLCAFLGKNHDSLKLGPEEK